MSAVKSFKVGWFPSWVVGLSSLLLPAAVFAQSDDFNDGNDAGWTHYEPLKAFGAGGTYSAAGGIYRLSAAPSPAPADLGVQRIGSLRKEKTYTRVRVQTEITGWRDDINQAFGLIGRAESIGLGTTTGYTYNYNSISGFHQINLVQNEQPIRQVNESPFRLNPAHRYRMVFQLADTLLLGQLYSVTNLTVPLHSVVGSDDNSTSGVSGVFAFALAADGPLDAKFDNYAADVPGQIRATMLDAAPAAGESPAEPIAQVAVRLANAETAIQPATVVLELDGAPVVSELVEEPSSLRIIYSPTVPLDASKPHSARVVFNDGVGDQVFAWNFGAASLPPATLVAAESPAGPFIQTEGAVLDAAGKVFRIGLTGNARFFRISDGVARRIVGVKVEGDKLAVTFE